MIHDISFYNLDGCELELPTTFEDCLSPEQQIIWLFLHKQDLLEAGDGVTLTPLPDGNVRISVEGGTGGSEYTMVKVAHPSAGNIAEYRLRDVTAGSYKGDIIEIPEGEQGKDGVGITSIVFKSEDIDGNYIYTVNLSDNTHYDITAPRGPEGERGATGSQGPAGQDGTDGTDGVSPTISVTQITGGHEVEITDAQGTTSFDVMDGVDGADGTNGTDGVSPSVTVTQITGGHQVSITDAQGTDTFDVMDGTDGTDGTNGTDGVSPTVTVTAITGGHEVSITDAQGTDTFDVMDGVNGQNGTDGTDGVSPSVTVTQITGGHQVSITDAQGTDTFNVMDGQDGEGNRIWYTLSNYEPWSVPNYTFNISDLIGVSGETPIAGDYVIQYYNSRTVLYYINAVGSTTVACRSICDLTGAPGQNGTNGTDGVSPTITVTSITGGHQISITDAQGTNTFNVMDGVNGQNGTNGTDGISPSVTVTQITGGHEVSITDAQGTDTFNVMDGVDGQQGQTGPAGPGVPTGGTAGQVLSKVDGADYNTQWVNPPSGGMNTDGSNAASHVRFNGAFTVGTRNSNTIGTNSTVLGLGTASGNYSVSEGYSIAKGSYSHAEGDSTASNIRSHAEGSGCVAYGPNSHVEGDNASTGYSGYNNYGQAAHAEGRFTRAYGNYAHAEGEGDSTTNVTASGEASHAEGYKTTASGQYSHAEGASTTASGDSSHAEGNGSVASGANSHAGGESGIASQKDQFAFGGLGIGEYKKLGFGFGCGLNISVDMGVVPPISSSEYVPFNKVIDARYGGGGLLHSNDNPQSSGDDKFYAFELEKYGVYLLTLVRMVTTPSYPALPANTSSLKSFAILIGRGSSQQVLIEGSDFSANQYRWKVQYDQVGGVGDVYNKRLFYIAINEPDVDSSTGNQMAYHFQLLRLI